MKRTRQEIFDLAWNGLKAQGFVQSADVSGVCLFRGPRGLKCAIGHCIPDDCYDSRMDSDGDHWNAAWDAAGVGEEDREFGERLQGVHDWGYSPEDMERRLRAFAVIYSLTIPS